jgi:phage shock protein PspC (stress-responsive transcriptional regulator)
VSAQSDLEQPGQRRVYRSADGRLLGGVARGLAEHLGTEVVWIRLAFVLLTLAGGIGIVLYGAFWIVLPQQVAADAPRRSSRRFNEHQVTQVVAFAALVLGACWCCSGSKSPGSATRSRSHWRWPRPARPCSGGSWTTPSGPAGCCSPGATAGIILRMVLGAVLVLGGSAFFLASRSNFADAGERAGNPGGHRGLAVISARSGSGW